MEQATEIDREPPTLKRRNRFAGAILALVGIFVVMESLTYDLGSLARMGPGFLPVVLGVLLVVFGALIGIVNDDSHQAASGIVWRPIVLILSAMLAFALLVETAGLAAATAALVYTSGLADPTHTWKSLTALFLVLLTAVYLIFRLALGIPFELISGVI